MYVSDHYTYILYVYTYYVRMNYVIISHIFMYLIFECYAERLHDTEAATFVMYIKYFAYTCQAVNTYHVYALVHTYILRICVH